MSFFASAQAEADLKATLQAELANLQIEEATLENTELKITTLENAAKALKPEYEGLMNELAGINSEKARLGNVFDAYNSRCGGTSDDSNYVRQCDRERERLQGLKDSLNARIRNFRARSTNFNTRRDRIRDEEASLPDPQSNEQKLRGVRSRIVVVQEELKHLQLNDSFLQDPRARERLSNECSGLSSDESIVDCMERIFDGAKSNVPAGDLRPKCQGLGCSTDSSDHHEMPDSIRANPQASAKWESLDRQEQALRDARDGTAKRIDAIERQLKSGTDEQGMLQVQLVKEKNELTELTSAIGTLEIRKGDMARQLEK